VESLNCMLDKITKSALLLATSSLAILKTGADDDLRLSNTTGILQKSYVVYCGRSLVVHPLLKISWIRPWKSYKLNCELHITVHITSLNDKTLLSQCKQRGFPRI